MTLSWKQYCYFSVEEIDQATYNVIKIKEKILELNDKLKTTDDNKNAFEKAKAKQNIVNINDCIERLEMSKECIKYYYGLVINL
jgi:predicted RNA-binding protein with EMAP domain